MLLDFYGTLVEEDGPIIRDIIRKVIRDVPECSGPKLARAWGSEFSRLLSLSYGDKFRTQRELEIESLNNILATVGSKLDPVELSEGQFEYWRSPEVRPGARDFLVECPVPVCVVSNIDRLDIEAAIEYTDLPITLSVTSEEARSYKPRSELFEAGMKMLRLDSDEVIHIGDSLTSDIAGARALSIDAAWVNDHDRELPNDFQVVKECRDLRDLLELF